MGQEVAAAQAAQQRAMVEASGADGALSLMVEVMQQASRRAAAAPPGMLRDIHNAAADFVSKLTVLARQSATESHDRADAAHAAVLRAQAAAEEEAQAASLRSAADAEAQRIAAAAAAAAVVSDSDAEARRAAAAEAVDAAARRSAAAEAEARRSATAEQTRPSQEPALFRSAAAGSDLPADAARRAAGSAPAPPLGDAAPGETPSPPAADKPASEPAAHVGDDSNLSGRRRVSASSPAAGDSSALNFLAQAASMQQIFSAGHGGISTRSRARVSAQDEVRTAPNLAFGGHAMGGCPPSSHPSGRCRGGSINIAAKPLP